MNTSSNPKDNHSCVYHYVPNDNVVNPTTKKVETEQEAMANPGVAFMEQEKDGALRKVFWNADRKCWYYWGLMPVTKTTEADGYTVLGLTIPSKGVCYKFEYNTPVPNLKQLQRQPKKAIQTSNPTVEQSINALKQATPPTTRQMAEVDPDLTEKVKMYKAASKMLMDREREMKKKAKKEMQ